jgi:hypothetical protein
MAEIDTRLNAPGGGGRNIGGWTKAGIGAGLGVLGIGLDMFQADQAYNQEVQQWKQQSDAIARSNQRQALMIREANTRTADIYGYQTGRFKQNLGFIQEEYARAGEDLQRQLGAEFAQSAYAKQAQLSALTQAVGANRAASEGVSRSRQRADVLGTLGTFGRNAAMEAERLAGVVGQTGRSREALGRQATQSIFNAYGDLGILPEMQRYFGQEVAARPEGPNMGMMIASGLLNTAKQAATFGLG